MNALSFDDIRRLTRDWHGVFDVACPECGPGRTAPVNRRRPVLRIWRDKPGFASFKCARCALQGWAGETSERSEKPPCAQFSCRHEKPDASDADRTARALELWNAAQPFKGSIAEHYLASRGLAYAGDALRFHPACPFRSERHPAMVALMCDIRSGAPRGVHRTALKPDGSGKAGPGKMMLGPAAGACIKLADDADVTLAVAIAEGVETALAIRNLPDLSEMPVWACLSAGALRTFPVLPGIETLWIGADHDKAGILAARECARRWLDAGREVIVLTPNASGADLADRGSAHEI